MKSARCVPHLVSLLTAAAPVGAQPIPAATPESMLCLGTYVATGRVVIAANADCRAESKVEDCAFGNFVDLEVEIIDVIGARDAPHPAGRRPHRGDMVSVRIQAFATLIVTATPRPPKPVLSSRKIEDTFVGKEFVLALTSAARRPAFSGSLWPMSEKPWVLDTLSTQPAADCPRRL